MGSTVNWAFFYLRIGSQRDAIIYACGTNTVHGLKRTTSDKQNAVKTVLTNPLVSRDEHGNPWSDRAIAKICKVSPTFVGKERAALTVHVDSHRAYTHNKSGKTAR